MWILVDRIVTEQLMNWSYTQDANAASLSKLKRRLWSFRKSQPDQNDEGMY